MRKNTLFIFILIIFCCATANLGAQDAEVNNYSLKSLLAYPYKTSVITIKKLAFKDTLQYAYNVSFTSMGLTVSGRLSIPAAGNIKGIVMMLRGYQRLSTYYTGKGTENASLTYIQNGWIVISPDFLGYALSSPIPAPDFMAQFYSTINAVELYKSLELALAADAQSGTQAVFQYNSAVPRADRVTLPATLKKICVWGHSNGGQVALHFLEIIQKPVDTVLWAPVCIDFPDSAGHFGRSAAWAENFKELYPARDFSLFNYLDKIADGTRIRLNHGDADTSTPVSWSDALSKAIEDENVRRDANRRGRILLRYERHRGADHNMYPIQIRSSVLANDALFWNEK